jgi:exodeoxyribonuclease V alpha subunit
MPTIQGKIIDTKALKNNTYRYFITDDKGNTDEYIFFSNGTDYPDGLDNSRKIIIDYEILHSSKYGQSNKIEKVSYGDFVTDIKTITDYLINRVKLSKTFVNKLIEKYQNDTLDIVFKQTNKLKEIKFKNLEDMLKLINEYKIKNANMDFCIELSKLGIASKYHSDIIKKLGIITKNDLNENIKIVKDAIYNLYTICKIPFKICDDIAMKKLNYKKDNDNRIEAFIIMMYKELNHKGMLYADPNGIQEKASIYQIPIELIIPKLVQINVNGVDYFTTKKICIKEKKIEKICNKLIEKKPITKIDFDEDWYINETQLDGYQCMAVKNAFNNCISIVTGAPGSGKSYIILITAKKLHVKNRIYVLAPTGAAVERLRTDNLESECYAHIMTLQSFIYRHKYSNNHNHNNNDNDHNNDNDNKKYYDPYIDNKNITTVFDLYEQYDEFIFFIDEMSMVDLGMFYDFMRIMNKIIDRVRIILLGDKNQLPSIKGGDVLNDLILSQKIVCTTLMVNHRQKDKSVNNTINDIPENAELVLEGKNLKENSNNVELIKAYKMNDIMKILTNIIKKYKIDYRKSSIIIPARKNGICVNAFNPFLQDIYNPDKNKIQNKNSEWKFRIGDKIIHGKNNKGKDIYNGSILVVTDVNYENNHPLHMECKYYRKETDINDNDKNYRIINYSNKNKNGKNDFYEEKLDLAYAMTVHKAQGKGYETVVVIVHSTMSRLLNKNMLYTALTRAKKKCIIIADEGGLSGCKKTMPKRITNLYRTTSLISDKITNQTIFFDDIMIIRSNLKKYLESKELCKLLTTNGINIVNLKNVGHTNDFNQELSKFYSVILKNNDLYCKLLGFNDNSHVETKKVINRKNKIVEV